MWLTKKDLADLLVDDEPHDIHILTSAEQREVLYVDGQLKARGERFGGMTELIGIHDRCLSEEEVKSRWRDYKTVSHFKGS